MAPKNATVVATDLETPPGDPSEAFPEDAAMLGTPNTVWMATAGGGSSSGPHAGGKPIKFAHKVSPCANCCESLFRMCGKLPKCPPSLAP